MGTWIKNLKNGDMNEKKLALKLGCDFKNLKPLSKLILHPKSLCSRRLWNSSKTSSHGM
jgi:hypothetical protein